MRLYHAEVFWPRRVRTQLPKGEKTLEYSGHARKEANSDRYGEIALPHSVNLDWDRVYIFEAEEERKGKISKVVFRMPLDLARDIVIAAIPQKGGKLFVKTVWINLQSDPHKTLDKGKYYKP